MAAALARDADARSAPLGGESRLCPGRQTAYLRYFHSHTERELDEYFGTTQRTAIFRKVRPDSPELTKLFDVAPPRALGFPPRLFTSVQYAGRTHGMRDFSGRESSSQPEIPQVPQLRSPVRGDLLDALLEQSGKLQALDRLLFQLRAEGQTTLVYCQMTRMMDILEEYLGLRGYPHVRLDGQMSVQERRQVVDRFMTDSRVFVFLLSTRAGSLGLNLTRANNVIFYESDWNPTSDA